MEEEFAEVIRKRGPEFKYFQDQVRKVCFKNLFTNLFTALRSIFKELTLVDPTKISFSKKTHVILENNTT